jgi:hypothetical protein
MTHTFVQRSLLAGTAVMVAAACTQPQQQKVAAAPAPAHAPAAAAPETTAARPDTSAMEQPDNAAHAQPAHARPPVVTEAQNPFYTMDRIDWPGPNAFRGSDGAPGPSYWQQRADYTIRATLDTTPHRVSGDVMVTYTNNSPDTLHFVWMQLDQNIYKAGSQGAMLYPPDTRTGAGGFEGGYQLSSVTVNGTPTPTHINDTMMRLELPAPLPPHGGQIHIAIKYSFVVPVHGSDRMGRDSSLYEIAQWYPRMAVYDDVRGWNTDQYLGQGEFYLEYGDIDYAVTVPAGYTVAGSGVLENPAEVLTATERQRLAKAITSREVIQIVTKDEAKGKVTPGTKTWRFRARNVRDVAWAAAPDFRWDATSVRGVLCQAYYQWPKAGAEWEQVAENSQWTIGFYSELVQPYPYPQATAVAGPVGGMEYPMFVMDGYGSPEAEGEVFRVNDHELGHQWFPMVVGSNERRYGWMDEGVNTYMNAFSQERRYGSDLEQWPRGMDNFFSFLGIWYGTFHQGNDAPLMTMPDHLPDQEVLGNDAYEKPAAVLLALRDHVVGPEAMDEALQTYAHRWSYKHPTPGDFFRTIENVSGQDLSWFWRGYFYSTDVLDIALDSVSTHTTGDGQQMATIYVHRNTTLLFPLELKLKLAGGATQEVRVPVDIWSRGEAVTTSVPVTANVVGARLWPDRSSVPDVNPKNDTWGDAPPLDPIHPATVGGLARQITAR